MRPRGLEGRREETVMAREWTLSRDEAEYLVDVLESQPENIGMPWELADQLRELFGMPPRKPTTSSEERA